MNIEELSTFYDRLETNPVSTSAVALWHAIVFVRDKNGLDGWFAVAASSLCAKTNIKERAFYSARNQLKDKGFIEYKPRGGHLSGLYKVINLDCTAFYDGLNVGTAFYDGLNVDKAKSKRRQSEDKLTPLVRQTDRQTDGRASVREESKPKTIWPDIEKAWTDVFKITMKPNHIERLLSYIEKDGMSESLVLEGIERAQKSDQRVLNYLWKTLTEWAKAELKTIDELVQHEKKRSPSSTGKKDNITKIEEIFAKRKEAGHD